MEIGALSKTDTCNYCHKKGHFVKDCRKKQADLKKGGPTPHNANSGKTCNYCKKTGHVEADCRKKTFDKGGGKAKGKGKGDGKGPRPKLTCTHCKKPGHAAKDCRLLKQRRPLNAIEDGDVDGDWSTNAIDIGMVTVRNALTCATTAAEATSHSAKLNAISKSGLLVDSGAAIHVCGLKNFEKAKLCDLKRKDLHLQTANGQRLKVYGTRRVHLKHGEGHISVTFVVADVTQPILSVIQLVKDDCKVNFTRKNCSITTANGVRLPLSQEFDGLPYLLTTD